MINHNFILVHSPVIFLTHTGELKKNHVQDFDEMWMLEIKLKYNLTHSRIRPALK